MEMLPFSGLSVCQRDEYQGARGRSPICPAVPMIDRLVAEMRNGCFGEDTVTLFLYDMKLQRKQLLSFALLSFALLSCPWKLFFSLLNCTFDDHEHQALNDDKEVSVRIKRIRN